MAFNFDFPLQHYVSADEMDTPAKVFAVLELAHAQLNACAVAARPFVPSRGDQSADYATGAFQGLLLTAYIDTITAWKQLACTTLVAELIDLLRPVRQPDQELQAV